MPDETSNFDNEPATPAESAPDPFDLDALRERGLEESLVERVILTVPVRRPGKREYFRVDPRPDYVIDAFTLERQEGLSRTTYWVSAPMLPELREHLQPTRLFTCVNKIGIPFLWPAKLPGDRSAAGRTWHRSALEVAEKAKTQWVRMQGNKDRGAYDLIVAKGDLGQPEWPSQSFRELVELAFKDLLIDSTDHPVVKEIDGLA